MTQSEPVPHLDPPCEPFIASLAWGFGIARERRRQLRKRRVAGLPVLLLTAQRGLVRMRPARVPALPWSAGLSLGFFEVPAARGLQVQSRGLHGTSSVFVESHIVHNHLVGSASHATAGLAPSGVRMGTPAASEARGINTPSAPATSHSRETATPAFVLSRGLRANRSSQSTHQSATLNFAASIAVALPVRARTTLAPGVHREGIGEKRQEAIPTLARAAASPTSVADIERPTLSLEPQSTIERTRSRPASGAAAPMPSPSASFGWSLGLVGALQSRNASAPSELRQQDVPAQRERSFDGALRSGLEPVAIAWRAPIGAYEMRENNTVLATGLQVRLHERVGRTAAATMQQLFEVAQSLKAFVETEVHEVRRTADRAAASLSQPKVLPETHVAPTDETVRELLSKMRNVMQEERFRSGKIR